MGARSKAELLGLTERILRLYTEDHLTITQIADLLQAEDKDIGREAVRRSLNKAKDAALKMQENLEKARVMVDAIKDSSGTEAIEAVIQQMAGFYLNAAMDIESLEVKDNAKFVQGIVSLAGAQSKITATRLNFQSGFGAAKSAVLNALKAELRDRHPAILEALSSIVAGLEPEK
jgi:predicted DNA-binding protein YlxM (UPF0122 family)